MEKFGITDSGIVIYIPINQAEQFRNILSSVNQNAFEKPQMKESIKQMELIFNEAVSYYWGSAACECREEAIDAYNEYQIARS
jgi:hypothetical protein